MQHGLPQLLQTTLPCIQVRQWLNTVTHLLCCTCVQSEVLAWELESSHLAQRCLRLPPPLLEAPLTALSPHLDGTLFLGDGNGNIWRLQVAFLPHIALSIWLFALVAAGICERLM